MLDSTTPVREVAGVTPENISVMVPSSPVLTSHAHGWRGVVLQRYKHPPGEIETPPLRDNLLVVNLSGQTLVEERHGGGRREQRWTDRGHMSLTPAGQSVSRIIKGRPDVLLVHLAPALVNEVAQSIYGVDPTRAVFHPRLAFPDGTVQRLGELLLNEAKLHGRGADIVADMLARSLIMHLLRNYSSVASQSPDTPAPSPGGRVRRVIDHMNEHLDEVLSLAALAEFSGLSQPQFARAFREATGEPPHRYLVELRVNRARDLLEKTDLSVFQIGMRCGFEQPNHFATTFRKLTGMSPRVWRTRRRF